MPAKPKSPSLATLAIHGAREPHVHGSPIVEPLVQSVNHYQTPGTAEGLKYTRYGNTPNAVRVQQRLALLEGAESSLVLSSGMAATASALLALLRPGDHLLCSQFIYGGTHRLLTEEFVRMGIDVQFVDPWEQRVWRRQVRKETRAIFVESPVNPTCRVLDIRPIASVTRNSGVALVVDSTFASPINFRPIEWGADVVIHSATKYLNGHHDVLAGVVSGTEPYIDEVLQKEMLWGQTPDPFALWLLERGMKTLDVRVKRANESALTISQWAEKKKEIAHVHYPGLPSHQDHAVAKATLNGFGGMLALELKGGGKAADRFLRKLKLITHAPSLGGVDSLISEPRFTSHAKMSSAERAAIGIPDGFLRVSIGLESADDIIADIEQALK